MLVRFWGVRGSVPSPLSSSQIKEKLSAILEKIMPEDIASAKGRERFLAGLPPWLYGTVGGNTPCVSINLDGFDEPVIFDCGTGLRELGIACSAGKPAPSKYHIFCSHFHWDHLQGFPFFNPAYNPSAAINFYAPFPNLRDIFAAQMLSPYFPVELENMPATITFHTMEDPVSVGPATITFKKMYHPGGSFSYIVRCGEKRFIYATDTELSTSDFLPNTENISCFRDADMIVLDSQYTLGEAIDKYNWGHSAFSMAADFSANWGIKQLVLFHHDPAYDDRKLYEILQSARWYLQRLGATGTEVSLATEGLEIRV